MGFHSFFFCGVLILPAALPLDTCLLLPYTGTGIETENRVIQHDYCEVTKRIHDLEKTDAKSD